MAIHRAINLYQRRHDGQVSADLYLAIGDIQALQINLSRPHAVQLLRLGHHLPCGRNSQEILSQQMIHFRNIVRDLRLTPLLLQLADFCPFHTFALVPLRRNRDTAQAQKAGYCKTRDFAVHPAHGRRIARRGRASQRFALPQTRHEVAKRIYEELQCSPRRDPMKNRRLAQGIQIFHCAIQHVLI